MYFPALVLLTVAATTGVISGGALGGLVVVIAVLVVLVVLLAVCNRRRRKGTVSICEPQAPTQLCALQIIAIADTDSSSAPQGPSMDNPVYSPMARTLEKTGGGGEAKLDWEPVSPDSHEATPIYEELDNIGTTAYVVHRYTASVWTCLHAGTSPSFSTFAQSEGAYDDIDSKKAAESLPPPLPATGTKRENPYVIL